MTLDHCQRLILDSQRQRALCQRLGHLANADAYLNRLDFLRKIERNLIKALRPPVHADAR